MPAVQVDERGGVDGRMVRSSSQIAVLVDAEGAHLAHPSPVVYQGGAVQLDGRPGAVPVDPVLGSDRHHRPAELADLAGDLVVGAEGEHLARGDARECLGPRLAIAAYRPAPPPALADDESGGPTEAVLIAEVDLHPVLGLGPLAARPAPRPALDRLDDHHDFADVFLHVDDHESGQSEHLRVASAVAHRQGVSSVGCLESPQR